MSDFPQTHTTHTTTTSTVTSSRVQFDSSYIKTIPGLLPIVEAVLALLTFICAVSACSGMSFLGVTYHGSAGCGWAGFVSFIAILLALGWLVFHLLHVNDALPAIPWILIELGVYAIWTLLFLTAGIALSVLSNNTYEYKSWTNTHIAAGFAAFFAFASMIIWGFHTFWIFREWRRQVGSSPAAHQGGGRA